MTLQQSVVVVHCNAALQPMLVWVPLTALPCLVTHHACMCHLVPTPPPAGYSRQSSHPEHWQGGHWPWGHWQPPSRVGGAAAAGCCVVSRFQDVSSLSRDAERKGIKRYRNGMHQLGDLQSVILREALYSCYGDPSTNECCNMLWCI
jgi:hypothetical protein